MLISRVRETSFIVSKAITIMHCIYIAAGLSLLTISVIFYHYLTKNYTHWEKKCIPCLKDVLPGFGNVYPMFLLRKNMTQLFEEFYNRTPGFSMVGFYLARKPALLIRDPELVKAVLQSDFASFSSNPAAVDLNVDRLMARSPFFLNGRPWRSSRQQLSSMYTTERLKYMYESIDTTCEKLVEYLDDKIREANAGVEIELKELFFKFTAEAVTSAAFGIDGNSFKDDQDGTFVEIGKIMFKPSFTKALKIISFSYVPCLAKILGAGLIPARVDAVFRKVIKEVMTYRAVNDVQRRDFLQLMINLKKSTPLGHLEGTRIDDDAIVSHSASFFFEGSETSSITLSFVGYQLARHPEIQRRLRDEVLKVIEKHDGITYEALHEMTYMEQVIHESMRLYPAGGAFIKVCTAETVLKGSDGISCQVTPGTLAVISVFGLHMDPEYWPDPQKFEPGRFSEENRHNRHKFIYLPFGGGPRVCIGMRIAMLQVKAGLATIIKNYELELSPRTQVPIKVDPHYFFTSPIGGLWINLKSL